MQIEYFRRGRGLRSNRLSRQLEKVILIILCAVRFYQLPNSLRKDSIFM